MPGTRSGPASDASEHSRLSALLKNKDYFYSFYVLIGALYLVSALRGAGPTDFVIGLLYVVLGTIFVLLRFLEHKTNKVKPA